MTSFAIGVGAAVLMFASGVLGLYLQRLLPQRHTSDRSRDMIGSVVGLLTLLLALVLGLLIWTAFGVYAAQKTGLQSLESSALQYDQALSEYGPEAGPGRAMLKDQAIRTRRQFWAGAAAANAAGSSEARENALVSLTNLHERSAFLDTLQPTTDLQKRLLEAARQLNTTIGQTRLMMSLQMDNPVPWPLLAIVVSWSLLMFCGFGLLSHVNAMTAIALAFGAFSVASAIFLIVELSQPYTGLFRVSPVIVEQITDDINK